MKICKMFWRSRDTISTDGPNVKKGDKKDLLFKLSITELGHFNYFLQRSELFLIFFIRVSIIILELGF